MALLAAADKADHEPVGPRRGACRRPRGRTELSNLPRCLPPARPQQAEDPEVGSWSRGRACLQTTDGQPEVEAILRSASKYRESETNDGGPRVATPHPVRHPGSSSSVSARCPPATSPRDGARDRVTYQVPIGLAAVLVLGVPSAAAARSFRAHVGSSHTEPPNIYLVAALPSGERKSTAFKEATRPLEEYEERLIRETQPTINRLKERRTREEASSRSCG